MFKIILQPASRVLLESKGQACRTVFVGMSGKEISSTNWGAYFSRLVNMLGKLIVSRDTNTGFTHALLYTMIPENCTPALAQSCCHAVPCMHTNFGGHQ